VACWGMRNHASEALAKLEAGWPEWQIWWVPRATDGHLTWCARRHDDHRHVISATSPDELAWEIEQQQEER
jgi:hypothetical protein